MPLGTRVSITRVWLRLIYFHDADSYSSSLNSGMAELLKTFFSNLLPLNLTLSSISKKVLLSHHSHFINLPLTLSISLSLSHTLSSPSQSHCTLIARFLKVEKYTECVGASALVYLSIVLEYLAAEVTKHFGFFLVFCGMEIFDIGGLGFWLFGFDWWNEIRVFFF